MREKATSPSSLAERVAARADTLSAAELRAATFMAEHPDVTAFVSAEKLGKLSGTSDATIVRTVKSLGYSGMIALKESLRQSFSARLTPAGRLAGSFDDMGDTPEGLLERMFDQQRELFDEARHTLRPENFTEAVSLIAAGAETVVCAPGSVGPLADYFALKLTRMGRRARAALESGYALADALVGIGPDSVVVTIKHSRLSREGEVVINHARTVGAPIILITDTLAEALADKVTVALSAPIGRSETFSSWTTVEFIIDALTLAVAARDRDRSLSAMTVLNNLREDLWGTHPIGRPQP